MAAPTLTLGGIVMNPYMVWQDRHVSQSVVQTVARTIGGAVVVWAKAVAKGQSITLVANEDAGWLTKAQTDAVEALSNQPGGIFTLDLNGTSFQVIFRHQDAPAFEATPFVPRLNEGDIGSVNLDYFMATIRLMTV